MSKYTTELRYICEKSAGMEESADYGEVNTILRTCHSDVIGDYPIFDENYRTTLDVKILKHYYTREISEETVGLWKLRLNSRMNEIMPYYNKLYSSELLKFNPLYDVDLHTNRDRSENTESSGSVTTNENRENNSETTESINRIENEERSDNGDIRKNATNSNNSIEETNGNAENTNKENETNSSNNISNRNSTDRYSDTPQGGLTGIENNTYLTNARIINNEDENNNTEISSKDGRGSNEYNESKESSNTSALNENEKHENKSSGERTESITNGRNEKGSNSGSSESNNENHIGSVEAYAEYVYGKRGGISYSKMLQEFRETFLNIDRMIINDLSDLFFGLWE